jgi:GTP-binding protein
MDERNFNTEKAYHNLPLVVIVGRPNVGKSTLFNRLIHKRRAITDPTPGVTRDPIEEIAFINDKPVSIMDTGGFKLDRDEGTMEAVMDELVVQKTLESLKKADLILLLLDATLITGEDEEFIDMLRPYWDKVIAAVNKTEGGRFEEEAWNYQRFGFKKLLFISAEHGDHLPELLNTITNMLDFSKVLEGLPKQYIKIAIMGKPNTGKSTLSNLLTNSNASIVSNYAGTTRDVVEGYFSFKNRDFQVIDTAGIRKKAKVNADVEYYSVNRAIKTLDRVDVLFYLIDAEEGLTEQDKKIIGLAHDRGRGIIFCLNKWDTQTQERRVAKKAEDNIRIMFAHMSYAPIVEISAKDNSGIKNLLNTSMELYKQLNRKISTSMLNMAIKKWLAENAPPARKSGHFKVKYAIQSSTNPIIFYIFASSPEQVPQTYITYLKNKMRSDLGFDKIPVSIELKSSRKKWEDRKRDGNI